MQGYSGPGALPGWLSVLPYRASHHPVYFGDVLVYSLISAESNRVGRNVSSNWCSVYVGTEHAGQTVTIVRTPLLEAAVAKDVEFLLGSHYSNVIDRLGQ